MNENKNNKEKNKENEKKEKKKVKEGVRDRAGENNDNKQLCRGVPFRAPLCLARWLLDGCASLYSCVAV
ncbi:hypothetical protein [Collinsella sp. AF38-3AC]|uniref:hypothetical protein n=1 Tax=Collinsella sp. AF38-3AC TaxID=2292015 RepID=UPI0011C217B7|nr:hypothetical protein [Collinsella sp. AF38-3AC]